METERGNRQLRHIKRKIDSVSKTRFSKKKNKLPKMDYNVPLSDFVIMIRPYDSNIRQALLRQYRIVKRAKKKMKEYKSQGIRGSYKLSPLQRAEIIELFTRMFTVSEVYKIINDEWGLKYSLTAVVDFKRSHINEIERRRNIYINDITKLRLVHKRARVEELMELYDTAKEKGWIETGVRVLDQINKEVEKNQLEVIHSGEVNINKAEKISIDIGLDNVKTLALLRVIQPLGDSVKRRISSQLLDKQSNIPMIGFKEKRNIGTNIEVAKINEATFTDLPNKDPKYKGEEVKEKNIREETLSKVKQILLKKAKKRIKRLNHISTDVDKLELRKRGENL